MGTLKDFTEQGLIPFKPVIKDGQYVIIMGTLNNSGLNTIVNKSVLIRENDNNKEIIKLTSITLVRLIHTLRDKLIVMNLPDSEFVQRNGKKGL